MRDNLSTMGLGIVCLLLLLPIRPALAESPSQKAAALSDFVELSLPNGPGPYKLAIMLPGCLSWHPHHDVWRIDLLSRGYAVLHVDSFSVRNLRSREVLERVVCTGMQLQAELRVGDVISVLYSMIDRADINFKQVVVFGWSHGGWTAMELLMRINSGTTPRNIDEIPDLSPISFRAAFLYYPYCGPFAMSGHKGYPQGTRTVLFHGTQDTITSPEECRSRARSLNKRGADFTFVSVKGASHWFDNHTEPSVYDGDATVRAKFEIDKVLADLATTPLTY